MVFAKSSTSLSISIRGRKRAITRTFVERRPDGVRGEISGFGWVGGSVAVAGSRIVGRGLLLSKF
jgi:hypothetical protein